jgi:hypothetical protein
MAAVRGSTAAAVEAVTIEAALGDKTLPQLGEAPFIAAMQYLSLGDKNCKLRALVTSAAPLLLPPKIS